MKDTVTSIKYNKKRIILLLVIIFVVLLVVAGLAAIMGINNKQQLNYVSSDGKYILDESKISSIHEVADDKVDEGMFEINMNTTWHFENGSKASDNAYVANSITNNSPIAFDIMLTDSQETVYVSPIIPLGSRINEIILDKKLSKGEYAAICTYHLLDDNGEELTTVAVNIVLDVRK